MAWVWLATSRWRRAVVTGLLLAAALTACRERQGNFSQHPGFAEWYAAHPPSDGLPSGVERALLWRYKPRVFLPAGHEGPIDFYQDYIGHGRLYDGRPEAEAEDQLGSLISDQVTPELLNAHKADPKAIFVHERQAAAATPRRVIYGRVDRDRLAVPGCAQPVPLTFLTYNLVFRQSGLPAALPGWEAFLLNRLGNLDDWHQLDHYTALTVALVEQGDRLSPIAVTFQQHNYTRSYLLGAEERPGQLIRPEDGRIAVDVAIRSNELYPHRTGRQERPAASFMDLVSARYLIEGTGQPWLAADDITEPGQQVDPELVTLPPSDAFYVFQGWLGARRPMPGQDGPPGADYNTTPPFKPKAIQLAASYWHEGDVSFLDHLGALLGPDEPGPDELAPLAERLAKAAGLACPDQPQANAVR